MTSKIFSRFASETGPEVSMHGVVISRVLKVTAQDEHERTYVEGEVGCGKGW